MLALNASLTHLKGRALPVAGFAEALALLWLSFKGRSHRVDVVELLDFGDMAHRTLVVLCISYRLLLLHSQILSRSPEQDLEDLQGQIRQPLALPWNFHPSEFLDSIEPSLNLRVVLRKDSDLTVALAFVEGFNTLNCELSILLAVPAYFRRAA